jgi:hypothetical protein
MLSVTGLKGFRHSGQWLGTFMPIRIHFQSVPSAVGRDRVVAGRPPLPTFVNVVARSCDVSERGLRIHLQDTNAGDHVHLHHMNVWDHVHERVQWRRAVAANVHYLK